MWPYQQHAFRRRRRRRKLFEHYSNIIEIYSYLLIY